MESHFYAENHIRDDHGRIIKRDYTCYDGLMCDCCKKEIKGDPAFQKRGNPDYVYGMGLGFKAPLVPFMDLNNVDYCAKCVEKFKNWKTNYEAKRTK